MPRVPDWLARARDHWTHRGTARPSFALPTREGEESVWDYPRPPALVEDGREVVVRADGVEVARSRRARRMLETASPPTFYLPPHDVHTSLLREGRGASLCEWKGSARYWDLAVGGAGGEVRERVAWTYPSPYPPYEAIAGWFCFYPSRVACTVAGEAVQPQAGDFYGGWITREVIGPFKGDPGTGGW